ncbi:unnamed protein product [Darwinula stevensoni]|uniref:All-trans-retinol 13,14-reductase n=1 Tax=Darwinula stevensoni TaxID=69355 RepID=A0A7R8XAL8_9CRUS|nr:unnamed protein product [Darwinula stevensoni]CAG0892036.1 unnamed protein product [Darwinula stevensoni]
MPDLRSLALGGLVILLIKILQSLLFKRRRSMFSLDSVRPPAPHVADRKLRAKVLKQSFSPEKVPHGLDAIVIGSGIGGLSAAALLAKAGKKVLVLEQNDQAGGCCHTFIEKGYEFDVGIHSVGEFGRTGLSRTLLDQLTDGQLEFVPIDPVYDVLKLRYLSEKSASYDFCSPKERWISTLKKQFPGEEEAVDKFIRYIEESTSFIFVFGVVKFLPLWLSKLVIKLGIIDWFTPYSKWASRSAQSVVEELTDNEDLRTAFTYLWAIAGVIPSDVSFNVMALLHHHYYGGSYYPRGGASEIPFHIIPVIEKSGGKVLVNANVKKIVLDESASRAVGVVVEKDSKSFKIAAPIIISNANVTVTLTKLLPEKVGKRAIQYPVLSRVRPSVPCMEIFLGLNASNEELKLSAQNYTCVMDNNIEELYRKYRRMPIEEALNAEPPVIYLAFPSAKDPTHDQRHPGKATCTIIGPAEYEWFRPWENESFLHRNDRYEEIKKTIGHRLIEQACKLFPQIRDKIDLVVIRSPLSHNHYLGRTTGDIYGLYGDIERFKLETQALLRPETGIEGLFLSGQDVMTSSLLGAAIGGVFCASKILNRNLMNELNGLMKEAEKRENRSSPARRMPIEEALNAEPPVIYLAFPSAKDPTHDQRHPGKATCTIIGPAEYEWFRPWENESFLHRNDRYEEIKKTIGHRLIEQACKLFPQIRDNIDLVVIRSPLSHNHYLGRTTGDIYGLYGDIERFKLETQALLRPETGIEGLFLSGQDVMTSSLLGAAIGGVFCASKILNRNHMSELDGLMKEAEKRENRTWPSPAR